jgi:hypothetical protein
MEGLKFGYGRDQFFLSFIFINIWFIDVLGFVRWFFHKTEQQWKNEKMGQQINLTKSVKSWTMDEHMWFNDV